jgi:hypothetical protein
MAALQTVPRYDVAKTVHGVTNSGSGIPAFSDGGGSVLRATARYVAVRSPL